MGGCRGQTHAPIALCAIAVAATMGVACGARTDLASFGEARGVSGSGTPSSGSIASTGLGSSGTFVSAGTTVSSGTFVSAGTTASSGTFVSAGVSSGVGSGVTSGSVVPFCPQTCEALGANCGVVIDDICATKVDCGACANGAVCGANVPNVCGPTPPPVDAGGPTVLADNQQSPTYIAVDAKYVYWTTSGSGAILWRAPLAGGTPGAFEKGGSALGITAQAGFVFALMANPSGNTSIATLTRAASGSDQFQTLWSGPTQASLGGPVANSISVYWSDAAAGTIWRMGIDGSDPTVVASGEAEPGPLAIDPKNLYWLSQQGIRMMPLIGGSVTTLGAPPPSPPLMGEAIAVNAFAVYSSPLIPPCTVWQTPLGGGGSTPLITSTPICAPAPTVGHGVAADGTNVYWTVGVLQDPQSDTGEILRTSPMGGAFSTIASGQAFPFAVTLDSQFVYWTNHGGLSGGIGQVMRAPK